MKLTNYVVASIALLFFGLQELKADQLIDSSKGVELTRTGTAHEGYHLQLRNTNRKYSADVYITINGSTQEIKLDPNEGQVIYDRHDAVAPKGAINQVTLKGVSE